MKNHRARGIGKTWCIRTGLIVQSISIIVLFPTRAHSGSSLLMKDSNPKKLIVPLAIAFKFQICSWCHCQQLHVVNKRSLTELYVLLVIRTQIANIAVRSVIESLMDSRRMGDGPISLKTSAPHSLMKTYRNNLISARFISLDSACEYCEFPSLKLHPLALQDKNL